MIDECLLEPVLTMAPVLLQIEAEVARRHLTSSIGDIAGGLKIAHNRIDDGHASLTFAPANDQVLVCSPLRLSSATVTVLVEDVVTVLVGPVVPEVPPKQLLNEVLRVFVRAVLTLPVFHLPVDGAWGEAAIGHPGTELGVEVWPKEAIPQVLIVSHTLILPEVVVQPLQRSVLATDKV